MEEDDIPRFSGQKRFFHLCARVGCPGIAEDEVLLNSGQCEYHTNMEWAKGSAKVADRPLIVKPAKLVGPNNVDIVVSNAAADKMRNSKMNFLAKCRVLVVKR